MGEAAQNLWPFSVPTIPPGGALMMVMVASAAEAVVEDGQSHQLTDGRSSFSADSLFVLIAVSRSRKH